MRNKDLIMSELNHVRAEELASVLQPNVLNWKKLIQKISQAENFEVRS